MGYTYYTSNTDDNGHGMSQSNELPTFLQH